MADIDNLVGDIAVKYVPDQRFFGGCCAAIYAALKDETIRAHILQSAWRPIGEAPKDGRTLLLGRFNQAGKWRTTRGQWFRQETINDEWENPYECEEGWYETSVENDDTPNCWATAPTHFQPLPLPPTGGNDNG